MKRLMLVWLALIVALPAAAQNKNNVLIKQTSELTTIEVNLITQNIFPYIQKLFEGTATDALFKRLHEKIGNNFIAFYRKLDSTQTKEDNGLWSSDRTLLIVTLKSSANTVLNVIRRTADEYKEKSYTFSNDPQVVDYHFCLNAVEWIPFVTSRYAQFPIAAEEVFGTFNGPKGSGLFNLLGGTQVKIIIPEDKEKQALIFNQVPAHLVLGAEDVNLASERPGFSFNKKNYLAKVSMPPENQIPSSFTQVLSSTLSDQLKGYYHSPMFERYLSAENEATRHIIIKKELDRIKGQWGILLKTNDRDEYDCSEIKPLEKSEFYFQRQSSAMTL